MTITEEMIQQTIENQRREFHKRAFHAMHNAPTTTSESEN